MASARGSSPGTGARATSGFVLDLKRVRIFVEVVHQGSFSAAASSLSYTQPAVSHQVAQLEAEIGTRLLDRSPRGLQLTPAGDALFSHARPILEHVANAEIELAEIAIGGGGRIRIGSFATASATLLPEAIVTLRRTLPGIQIDLIESEPPETLNGLRAQKMDLGLVFDSAEHPLAVGDGIDVTEIGLDAMYVALPAGHRHAQTADLRMDQLRDELWVEGAGSTTPCSLILLDACRAAGFEPRVTFNSGNYEVVKRLVAAGMGLAVIPGLAARAGGDGVVLRRLSSGALAPRRVRLARPAKRYRSGAVQAVFDALVAGGVPEPAVASAGTRA